MTRFIAHVVSRCELTHDVRELRLGLDDPPEIQFAAGQFVSFEVAKPGVPVLLTRPYSIASPPGFRRNITLLFNVVPGGPGSSFLDRLRPHDPVPFKGPAGTFVLREYPERDLLFVATGTGIAPFRSMLPAHLSRTGGRSARLIWGLRSERDLYYQDELHALAARDPRFSFTMTLSRPAGAWTGRIGRVQGLVDEAVTSVERLAVYVCGNSGMIADVTAIVRRKGLCPIHAEQYYRDSMSEPTRT